MWKERTENRNEEKDEALNGEGGKDLKGFLESKGLEVIDKRAAGGCLWVVGDKAKIASVITEAGKLYGAYGNYSGGGKATKNRPGWFTKCKK